MSVPGAALSSNAKRTASVPYFSVTSSGSMHVALGLRHLLPLGVAHQAVDVDLAERHIAHELEAHHDHARHPEEQDVEARDQQRCRDRSAAGRRSRRASPAWKTARAPELNQVSSTSVSCASCAEPHCAHFAGASRATMISPHVLRSARRECDGPTRAGARCTSRGCCTSSRSRSCSSFRG